jgi:transposase
MPGQREKLRVYLKPKVRKELEALCRQGCVSAAKVRKARILLFADENQQDHSLSDREIAERVGLCQRQVVRIRQQFVREGGVPALERKKRSRPGTRPKFDGRAEARLVALCCSQPPEGRARWTMRLLADELGRLQIVTSVCAETVRKCLKKTGLSLGNRNASAFRSRTGHGS